MAISCKYPSYLININATPLPFGDDGSFAYSFWCWMSSGVGGALNLQGNYPSFIQNYSNFPAGSIPNGTQFVKVTTLGDSRFYAYGGRIPLGGSDDFAFYGGSGIPGWNHVAFVSSGTSLRYVYVNGQQFTNTSTVSNFSKLDNIYFSENELRGCGEVAWWGSGITPQEVNLLASGFPPSIVAKDRLYSYFPLYNTDYLHDKMGNLGSFFTLGTPSGTQDHPPIKNLAKPYYPRIVNYNTFPLFLQCGPSYGCLPYSSGDGAFSNAFDFDFDGQLCGSPPGWHMTLYMDARQISSGTMDLYQYGQAPSSGDMTLFLKVIDNIPQIENESSMNLFLQGQIAHGVSGDMSIFMWSSTNSGLYEHMDLFIDAASSGVKNQSMNLMLKNELADSITSTMNVMLKGLGNSDGSISINENFPLYLANDYTACSGDMTLVMCGPSGTDGAIPFSGMMNLFMGRQNDSFANNISLYMSGPDGFSGTMTMYLEGQPRPTGVIPLYIEAPNASVTEHVTLYTHGF